MKSLILAGGLGTRLRPLTNTRPKHLLPVANVPHVEHVFNLLQRHGIADVVLLTSYLASAFEEAVAAADAKGMNVEVAHEREPLGTAGALKNAEELLGDETFLVFNGDILTDADLGKFLSFHEERGAEASILLAPVDDPSSYGVVPTDEWGRVLGFVEKPSREQAVTNLINAGVYALQPSVLDRIPRGEVWSAERALFPQLVAEGAPVYAVALEAYWIDIGTPDKYIRANVDVLRGLCEVQIAEPSPEGVLSAPGAVVDPAANVSFVSLGREARVEAGAQVRDSVLLPGCVVGSGATVTDSVLGERARVLPGAHLANAALADGEIAG